MTVAIVVVSFNARADLARCLASLRDAPPAIAHEVVVVDNGSTDGADEMVARDHPSVRLIRAGGNLGFSRANNLAIRSTSGDLILLLNPDTIVPEGAVDRMCERLESRPDVAALGPRLVDPDGRAELSFGRLPGPFAEAWQKGMGALHDRRVGAATRWVERRARQERLVDWVSGACLLVRRDDAVRAGLLDERFFIYWEDADFCARLRGLGRGVLFSPVAEVVHARGRSVAAASAPVRDAYRRGQLAFYTRYWPRWVGLLRVWLRLRRQLPTGSAGPSGLE